MKVLKLLLLTPLFILIFIAVATILTILLPLLVCVVFSILVALLAGVDFNIDITKPKMKVKYKGEEIGKKKQTRKEEDGTPLVSTTE